MGVLQSSSVVGTPEECRELSGRICTSPPFQRSPRIRQLLLYLTSHAFDGDYVALKESAIGESVYGRARGYNTNDDNIVRMGVSQLRHKLAEYFDQEGKDEALRIDIPKGSYVPVFTRRTASQAPSPIALPAARASFLRSRWPTLAIAAGILGALVPLSFSVLGGFRHAAPASPDLTDRFWQEAVGDGRSTLFAAEDLSYLLADIATKGRISASDYADDRALPPEAGSQIAGLQRYGATTRLSLHIATRLLASQPVRLGHSSFVPSREIRIEDFKEKNLILVGSPRACPWIDLFHDSLNFEFYFDRAHNQSSFRNRRPRPGEQAVYTATLSNADVGIAYSVLALLPNLAHTGKVLILSGTGSEGTEAAADAVTNPYILKQVLESIGYDRRASLPAFEVLLESHRVAGVSVAPRVIASRIY